MLKWTKQPDGSETAGPFTLEGRGAMAQHGVLLIQVGFVHGSLSFRSVPDAKSAAERIAAGILANVKEGDHDAKST